jgi:hypothetical protein
MTTRSLRERLLRAVQGLRTGRQGRRPGKPARRLAVEPLEDRTLLSTLAALTSFDPTLPESASAGGVSQAFTSANGSYTVYTSTAANVVSGQVNLAAAGNIFFYDRQAGTTTLVSHDVASSSTGADGDSSNPRVSADGRYVVYESTAPDLAFGQSGPRGQANVFLYDRNNGNTTLISHAFGSTTTAANDASTTRYTTGFGFGPDADRYLLFSSSATNLLNSQGGPHVLNLFLYDTSTGAITLVSHDVQSSFEGADDVTEYADLTPDGSAVVFQSQATDLVFDQTGDTGNVFLYQTATATTRLVSGVLGSAADGAGSSFQPLVSADGSVISYVSDATNLVSGQTTSGAVTTRNVFAYATAEQTTTLVSGADGSASATGNADSSEAALSSDGSTIAFVSEATNLIPGQFGTPGNVFVFQRNTGKLTLASYVGSSSLDAAGGVSLEDTGTFDDFGLSADGSRLVYLSTAGNIVPGQVGASGIRNAFVYQVATSQNALASHVAFTANEGGDQDTDYVYLSANGSTVAFLSFATFLAPGFNVADGGQNLYVVDASNPSAAPFLVSRAAFAATAATVASNTSADGRFVVFTSNATDVVPGQDTDGIGPAPNVFLLDRDSGSITLVSHISGAAATTGNLSSASPVISADGSTVVFVSTADDLVPNESGGNTLPLNQVYLFNRLNGKIALVSHTAGSSTEAGSDAAQRPVVSADGHYVAYDSFAPDLIQNLNEPSDDDTDNVYLYDATTGTNTLVSADAATSLTCGDHDSSSASISADGRFVAYQSRATNLVSHGSIAPTSNVYLFDRIAGTNTLVSHVASSTTVAPAVSSTDPVLSDDGSTVAFVSSATDLVSGQAPTPYTNVFLYGVNTGIARLASGSPANPANGDSDSPALSDNGSVVAFRSDASNLVPEQLNGSSAFTSNVFRFGQATGTVTLVSHANGQSATTASGDSSDPAVNGAGDLVVYRSTAPNLVPGQQGGGVENVYLYSVNLAANALVSGQDGSPVSPGSTPAFGPAVGDALLVTFSDAGGLVTGTQGTSVAYANALLQLTLAPNTIPTGSPSGTVVGTLSTSTVFGGQAASPAYSLPAGEASNAQFSLSGTASLLTAFQAAAVQSYPIVVHVNAGFGAEAVPLVVNVEPAGQLAFSAGNYSVSEHGGSATITVSRSGGVTGAVSVLVSTSDGTATAGTDYTAVSKTVSWADGDTAPKTVTVPITDRGLTTGQRTVNLALGSPGGGATLGSPASAVLTILDNDTASPAIISPAATTFTVGAAGSFTVMATGAPAPTLSESTSDILPGGVGFTATTGVLSGTPAAGSGGTYTLHFTAHNSAGPDAAQTFVLTVNQAAAFTSAAGATFTAGAAGSFKVTASGFPAPALSESPTDTLPAGVSFNAATSFLSGTPAAGSGGTYTLHFTAHNGVGADAAQTFTLTVDEAPAFTSANNTTFVVGAAGSFTVAAAGFPSPTLSESATDARPGGITFNAGTGLLSGTPAAGSAATYTLHFTAHNGIGADATQTFTLTVNPGGQAPTFTSAAGTTFTAGTAGSLTVTATGSPTPVLSEDGTDTLPSGVTFNAGTGVLSGTPAAGSGKVYTLHFTASNGLGSVSQTFTLTVNEAPAFSSANGITFTTGTPGSFIVTASGFPVPVLSESAGDSRPSGVSFMPAGGVLMGTPAAGSGGVYTLHFTAHNGIGADATQTFTLTVDQAAAFTSAAATTFTAGAAGSFTVTAGGFPAPALSEDPGDNLPGGVSFSAATGVLGGTPAAGSAGSYPLHFTAHNGVGADATQTFTLTVNQAGQAPTFTSRNSTTFTVGATGNFFTVTATGSPPLTLSETASDTLPTGVTFDPGTGLLVGPPATGSGGTYTLHFTASSSAGSTSQIFTLIVDEAPAFTVANDFTFTAGTVGSARVTARGFPLPTLSEATGDVLPGGLGFNPAVGGVGGAAVGLLSGTPAAGSGGTYTLHLTAGNSLGSVSQAFTVTVNQAPAFTSANGAGFTAGSPGAFQVSATGFPAPVLSESGALPAGVTFNPATGILGGTPAPGSAGTYPVSFSAGNGVGNAVSQTFTLTVNPPPPITGPLNLAGLVGVSVGPLTSVGKRRKTGGSFSQTVSVTNNGPNAIQGPIILVLDSLTPRKKVRKKFVPQVTVAGAGTTRTVSPGSPFVLGPALLPVGGTTSFRLTFQRKGSGTITFNPVLLTGYAQP